MLECEKRVPDLPAFLNVVVKRELLVSTEMETGLAFPHGRLPGVVELSFALGRSQEPLAWGAKAPRSVRLVFLIAAPVSDSTPYLPLISGLARLTRDARLVERLHAAPDALQMFEVLREVELPIPSTPGSGKPPATQSK